MQKDRCPVSSECLGYDKMDDNKFWVIVVAIVVLGVVSVIGIVNISWNREYKIFTEAGYEQVTVQGASLWRWQKAKGCQ